VERAKARFKTDSPTEKQIEEMINEMIKQAVKPLKNKKLVETLIYLYRKTEQTIDEINKDRVISADFSTDEAKQKVESFKAFIKENKNELDALQIIYSKSYKQRHLTYEIINKLADAIKRPPYNLTPEVLWMAYEKLEKAKIRGGGPLKLLTNIISLVRFAINDMPVLEPFTMLVDENFGKWVKIQESIGRKFTDEQKWWLENIKEHIASSGAMEMDDFDLTPFSNRGGLAKADKVFGGEVGKVVEEMNEVLVA
jgi:type I restriction enzyme, R subunit